MSWENGMGSFKVIISPKALMQLEEYIDYIQYTLMNEPASKSVWDDSDAFSAP